MYVVKNTYGVSSVVSPQVAGVDRIGEYGGSSLNRKTYPKKVKSVVEEFLKKSLYKDSKEVKEEKLRSMSQRTKAKIRKKIIAFAGVANKLSFLTLTFCDIVC